MHISVPQNLLGESSAFQVIQPRIDAADISTFFGEPEGDSAFARTEIEHFCIEQGPEKHTSGDCHIQVGSFRDVAVPAMRGIDAFSEFDAMSRPGARIPPLVS